MLFVNIPTINYIVAQICVFCEIVYCALFAILWIYNNYINYLTVWIN